MAPKLTESAPLGVSYLPEPEITPAPIPGEHTIEILEQLLGLSTLEIDSLVKSGDIDIEDSIEL